jgi:hypothetical protein
MSTIQAGFGQTLTRASTLPLFLFLAVVAYLVPSALFASHPSGAHLPLPSGHAVWKASYSEKYPGCVSTVLWPAAEKPVALVVVRADGRTARLTRDEAVRNAAAGDVASTIGACRSQH